MQQRKQIANRGAFWVAWLGGVAAFGVMCGLAAAYDRFPGDLWLAHRVQDFDDFHFGAAAAFANNAGDTVGAVVITLAFAVALLLLRKPRGSLLLLASFIPRALRQALVQAVARPRPSAALVQVRDHVSGFSFPSGHATTAFVLYGTLFVLAGALIVERRLRLLFRTACVTMIILTGLARVYVGAHWPSDVVGGFAFGALAMAPLFVLYWKRASEKAGSAG